MVKVTTSGDKSGYRRINMCARREVSSAEGESFGKRSPCVNGTTGGKRHQSKRAKALRLFVETFPVMGATNLYISPWFPTSVKFQQLSRNGKTHHKTKWEYWIAREKIAQSVLTDIRKVRRPKWEADWTRRTKNKKNKARTKHGETQEERRTVDIGDRPDVR